MGGNGGQLAISELQDLTCPARLSASSTYFHQDTSDIPDHMLEKGIRLDVHNDETMMASNLQTHDFPERRPGLAAGCTERSEIVLAQQMLPGFVHAVDIQCQARVGQLAGQDGGFDSTVENHVVIAPG